ncbi:LysR family transcriptional regulator [Paraburkholderia sp. GAS32]|uniref:LysR family transcriptional regulator n=1 Tax=Paraburkholderia sp. GAS32 TaxID=3035129 RepID=UPI003D244570
MRRITDLKRLRAFVAVADLLHFGRAAELLGIAQPALSQQIQQLEREIGAPLLIRDRRSVNVTPVGMLFLTEARNTLAQAEKAALVVTRANRGELGEIDIGLVTSVAYSGLLSRICYVCQQRMPDVKIRLQELDPEQQLTYLADGHLDVAFIRLPVAQLPEGVITSTLRREPVLVCLRSDHSFVGEQISVCDLAGLDFIATHLREGYGFYDTMLRVCRTAGFEPRIVHRSRNFPMIVSLVAAGCGVALIPEPVSHLNLPDVVYRPLSNVDIVSDVAVAYRKDEPSPAVRRFISLCREIAPLLAC